MIAAWETDSVSSNCWNIVGIMMAVVGSVSGREDAFVAPVGFVTP